MLILCHLYIKLLFKYIINMLYSNINYHYKYILLIINKLCLLLILTLYK